MVEVFNDPTTIDVIVKLRRTIGSVLRPDLEDLGQFTSVSTNVFDRNGSRYTLFYDDFSKNWSPFQATIEPIIIYEE